MLKYFRFSLGLFAIITLMCSANLSSADVLASNFDSISGVNPFYGYNIFGTTPAADRDTYPRGIAIPIHVDSASVVESYELPLSKNVNYGPNASLFILKLFPDQNGMPAQDISTSLDTIAYNGDLPGLGSGGYTTQILESSTNPTLAPNTTYWLAILPAVDDSSVGWYYAREPYPYTMATYNYTTQQWTTQSTYAAAYRIHGQIIPEPASLILFGLPVLGLLKRRRNV